MTKVNMDDKLKKYIIESGDDTLSITYEGYTPPNNEIKEFTKEIAKSLEELTQGLPTTLQHKILAYINGSCKYQVSVPCNIKEVGDYFNGKIFKDNLSNEEINAFYNSNENKNYVSFEGNLETLKRIQELALGINTLIENVELQGYN